MSFEPIKFHAEYHCGLDYSHARQTDETVPEYERHHRIPKLKLGENEKGYALCY